MCLLQVRDISKNVACGLPLPLIVCVELLLVLKHHLPIQKQNMVAACTGEIHLPTITTWQH
jgi:hypothetical protein